VQAGASSQPVFVLNGYGSLPVIQSSIASGYYFDVSNPSIPQPYSVLYIQKPTATGQQFTLGSSGLIQHGGWLTPSMYMFAGTTFATAPGIADNWYARLDVVNGASSVLYLNGAGTVSNNPGPNAVPANTRLLSQWDGQLIECAIWSSVLTSTQATSLANNQRTYYSGSYVGPGDIVTGATAWWGLRAYSWGGIGKNIIRLRRSGDNAQQDFATVAGGGLDLTAISTFKGSANLFVAILYDQTGNGRDAVQATAGSQPPFTLNVLGGKPVIDTTTSQGILYAVLSSAIPPATFSTVFQYQGSGDAGIMVDGGQIQFRGNYPSAGQVTVYSGGSINAAVSRDAWHASNSVFGSAADLYVDGTSLVSGSSGAGAGFNMSLLAFGAGSQMMVGYMAEAGVWLKALSPAQRNQLNTNQHTYWGF
jgi:hypothetical protein